MCYTKWVIKKHYTPLLFVFLVYAFFSRPDGFVFFLTQGTQSTKTSTQQFSVVYILAYMEYWFYLSTVSCWVVLTYSSYNSIFLLNLQHMFMLYFSWLIWNTADGFGRSALLRAYSKCFVINFIEIVNCWIFSTIPHGFWHIVISNKYLAFH